MGIEVYLGEPPKHIKDWIINNSKPAGNPKTHIKFTGGTEGDYLIEGVMDDQALIAVGLIPSFGGEPQWSTQPLEVNVGSAVTSIGNWAFNRCTSLTSVTIPNSVTSIVESAFKNCSSLTSVVIPNSVTTIGNSAFYSCFGLTSMTIPESVVSIGSSAFNYCSGLTSITIPNSVTSIADYAFSNCGNLTSVTIGNGVTSIGQDAFYSCTKLTSIAFPGKDMATVQDMANKPWGLTSGGVIHCSDGDLYT